MYVSNTIRAYTYAQISQYTTGTNIKKVFKMLKEVLPGPYTFIFPATNDLPRMVLEHKKHTWKRKEIGIRIPDNDILLEVLRGVEHPLLVTRYLLACTCMRTYVYIHAYTSVLIQQRLSFPYRNMLHMYPRIHTHAYTKCANGRVPMAKNTSIHIHLHMYPHIHTDVHTKCAKKNKCSLYADIYFICIHTYMHTHI
jgi:hypothetical protein